MATSSSSSLSTSSSKGLVVITGASSGIGEATARLFSSEGYPLLLIARRLQRMESLELPNTMCAAVDVTDAQAMKTAIDEAEKHFKQPVQTLVNNAGVMQLGQMHKQDTQEWRTMMEVNIFGVMNGIRAVLAGMKERHEGMIINISSVAGRKTFPNHAVYCATKFGVHSMSEALREEVAADGVRVCTIAPGVVETELLQHTNDETILKGYNTWKKQMGKPLDPKDVAHAILFAANQPKHVCVREIVIAPTTQAM